MENYLLRDAITQQVIQTGEDVVLFNINNPLSRTNDFCHKINRICYKILDNNFVLKSFSNFIVNKNDEIINLFKSHGSQGSCVSSKLLLLERVIQLFQYFIAFVRYKLDNFIIFLPNQYYGEEDIAYE